MPWLLAWMSLQAIGAEFFGLNLPGSQLTSLSLDGRTAVGSVSGADGGGFRWRRGSEPEMLREVVSIRNLSALGNIVVGSSLDREHREVASYWDDAGQVHLLASLPGAIARSGVLSLAFDATDAGRVVGLANDANDCTVAVVWNAGLPSILPLPAGAKGGRAVGISRDGSGIYGDYRVRGERSRGVLWKADTSDFSAEPIGTLNAEMVGGNRDGTLFFGVMQTPGHAFVLQWDGKSDPRPIVQLPSGLAEPLVPLGASDEAGVLVGSSGVGASRKAVLWATPDRPQSLLLFLKLHKVTVPRDWSLAAATAVSADGRYIGGWGEHQGTIDSFIVDMGEGL